MAAGDRPASRPAKEGRGPGRAPVVFTMSKSAGPQSPRSPCCRGAGGARRGGQVTGEV